jgi:hypothetical protein
MRDAFDFDISGLPREQVMAEAALTVRGLESELGSEQAAPGEDAKAIEALLSQLGGVIAEFGASPDILPLTEEHFTAHGLPVPVRFRDLAVNNRFYWIRLPITLMPADGMPFVKLECAVEFNPGQAPNLRPRASSIFPDKKFQEMMKSNTALEFGLSENLDLDASAGLPKVKGGIGSFKADASASGKLGATLGVKIGPFQYVWKRALIDNTGPGKEKVFWRIEGAEFFQEDQATFVIVLQVPRAAAEIKIAAALQAYPEISLLTANLSQVMKYLTSRAQNFFRGGAPVRDTRVWDLSGSL